MERNCDTTIPFAFFASLVRAIAAGKQYRAGHTPSRRGSDARSGSESYAARTFANWVAELHRRYDPLPPGTTAAVFRLLFPEEDAERKYGMQETRLAQCVGRCLAVETGAEGRGRRLVGWKDEDGVGCLGTEIQAVMEEGAAGQATEGSRLSIAQVDALLTALASRCAFSGPSVRHATGLQSHAYDSTSTSTLSILRTLYTSLAPVDACIVTQIILKDLRPVLYPLPGSDTHYTALLREYNTRAVTPLALSDAMRAWDPSGCMHRAWGVRKRLGEAAAVYEAGGDEAEWAKLKPRVGTQVQIPKCLKGQGCASALRPLGKSKRVWAETKYDGERAQIHVGVVEGAPRLTIYSKSGRDSTWDRAAIHSTVIEALGLDSANCQVKTGVILEAEMVAYSDILDRIDEFWRIRSLIASTAIGPRHARVAVPSQEPEDESQCSMISNASDGGTRHLALVFFDVLLLNDDSLLATPYSIRRAILESLIQVTPGHAMLAERSPIVLAAPGGAADGAEQLRTVFAQMIADHQEGLVLKADESRYNDRRFPWVKLKKDYIPGYGDSLDLVVVGASWEKERARELRVAPTAYTTFYLGVWANKAEVQADPKRLPHFEVYSTVSYGLNREELEEVNFMLKNSDHVERDRGQVAHKLTYTYNLFSEIAVPAMLLREPFLVEVFGAGFTKAAQCQFYELRFPRLTKFFRPSERSWTDCTTVQDFHRIAREAVGRDPSNKGAEDWCAELWGKPAAPGAKDPLKRKHTESVWLEKLRETDGKENEKRRRKGEDPMQAGPTRAARAVGEMVNAIIPRGGASPSSQTPKRLRVLGSMINVSSPVDNHEAVDLEGIRSPSIRLLTTPPSSLPSNDILASKTHVIASSEDKHFGNAKNNTPDEHANNVRSAEKHTPTVQQRDSLPLGQPDTRMLDFTTREDMSPKTFFHTPVGQFLKDAIVWLAKPVQQYTRPSWRVPARSIIPTGHQVHGLESFLQACNYGTSNSDGPTASEWAQRGVVFVDDTRTGPEHWAEYPLKTLMVRRTSFVMSDRSTEPKPIWVFSVKMLSYESLRLKDLEVGDIESRALCRIG